MDDLRVYLRCYDTRRRCVTACMRAYVHTLVFTVNIMCVSDLRGVPLPFPFLLFRFVSITRFLFLLVTRVGVSSASIRVKGRSHEDVRLSETGSGICASTKSSRKFCS